MRWTVHTGNCIDVMREMPDNSVDSVVTDPPYGLAFMGKKWDYDVPSVEIWRECLRVLKPGGHLLAFAGTRTQHRMAVRIEDAGFEIRDMIAWVYGSGFPKSLDVSKAIDKIDAAEAARRWSGWGTALKPSLEPITVARKPLSGTVAGNVLEWGTGALNVDGCRVGTEKMPPQSRGVSKIGTFEGADGNVTPERTGRWPANLIHDNGSEATALLGDAARFFYHAKASGADRDDGCETLPQRTAAERVDREAGSAGMNSPRAGAGRTSGSRNHHPTVKPTDLMRYLCRLVTPPGGTVLDPFTGSGSTGRGAVLEGFSFVGAEMDADYAEIARARIGAAAAMRSEEDATQSRQLDLFGYT